MQKTLKKEIVIEGIGVHTGDKSSLILRPAPPNTGIIFIRENETIPALIEFAVPVEFSTALEHGQARVRGFEHLLSSLYGLGVDNVICEMLGEEAPALDGSALPFIEAIEEVGICVQNTEKAAKKIESPIYLTHNEAFVMAVPDEDFRVSYLLDYGVKYPGIQYINLKMDPKSYKEEIGAARTYAFTSWLDDLRSKGLIKGGSLDNAIVIDEDGPIGSKPLRYDDEFVRHKILDMLGDLALLGYNVRGHIFGMKSGHQANISFVKRLKETLDK